MKYIKLLAVFFALSMSSYIFADNNSPLQLPDNNIVMLDSANPFGSMDSTTFSLELLQAKQQNNFTKPVILGADAQVDLQRWGGSLRIPAVHYQSGISTYLTSTDLFIMGNFNSYISIFGSLKGAVSNNDNDNTTFDQGMVVIGDLNKNPFFLTAGKSSLPFGSFAGSSPWSNTITGNDFEISSTDQIDLGYYKNGLLVNFVAQNPIANPDTKIAYMHGLDNFIYNLNYNDSYDNSFNYSIGTSYLTDIRGSQSNIGQAYNTQLQGGKNPAYDFNSSIGYGDVILYLEYASTSGSAINSSGTPTGTMSSWLTSVNYSPTLWDQSTTFSLSYSESRNMQDVPYNLSAKFLSYPVTEPGQGFRQQWLTYISRPLADNVYLSPIFEYAKTYNDKYTWTATLDLTALL